MNDFESFAKIEGKLSRRTTATDDFSTSFLQRNKGKVLLCSIYMYSATVSSGTVWKEVKEKLIKPREVDRAGATTTALLFELTSALKEKYRPFYSAYDICWSQWANFIQSEPAHLRQLHSFSKFVSINP